MDSVFGWTSFLVHACTPRRIPFYLPHWTILKTRYLRLALFSFVSIIETLSIREIPQPRIAQLDYFDSTRSVKQVQGVSYERHQTLDCSLCALVGKRTVCVKGLPLQTTPPKRRKLREAQAGSCACNTQQLSLYSTTRSDVGPKCFHT